MTKTKGKTLTLADIIAAVDIKTVAVDVPEWGGVVYVKAWTAGEREAFEASILGADSKVKREGFRSKAVALSLCDDAGGPLCPDGDISALQAKSATALDRVFAAADRLNAITGLAEAEAEGN